MHRDLFATDFDFAIVGRSRLASTAIIATTTSSSISVKPKLSLLG